MQSVKETAANMAASAKAGMEKTKATMQEKVDKMRANDPVEKEMAMEQKEARINQAEINKQEAREHNAAAKQSTKVGGHNPGYTATGTGAYTASGPGAGYGTTGMSGTGTASYSTSGAHGHSTGAHQMSALPGHGTGQPTGRVTEGLVETRPIGINSGTGHNPSHNTRVEGTGPGYGTGGTYS